MGKCVKVFILLSLMISAFFAAPAVEAAEPYRIGAVLSVTGPASFLGEPERNAAIMLQNQINKAGGINGRPLEIIIEDSKSDETSALISAKKLIEKDKVLAIIGPSTTGESMALVPYVNASKTPLISMATGTAITTPIKDRAWIFKVAPYDYSVVEALFDYMKRKGFTKVGILTISTGYGDAGRKALLEVAPKYGIKITADERYGPKDSDMTAQLVKIKNSGATAVINWSVGPGQVIVTKNWNSLRMNIPLFQSHGWGSKRNIALAGKTSEGVISPLGRIVVWNKLSEKQPQKALLKKFSEDYEAAYKSEPGTFGGHAYDSVLMLVQAIKSVGADKAKIRDYLENKIKKWPGTGGIFNMSPKDHCGIDKSAFEIVRVNNGDWEIVK